MFLMPDGHEIYATIAEYAAHKTALVKAECEERIIAVAPYYKQHNVALGIIAGAEADAIRQHIADQRAICNGLEADILSIVTDPALTDQEKIEALYAVTWPT